MENISGSAETTKVTQSLIADILKARGYELPAEQAAFLYPSYESHLHDPFLLKDMDLAVERILLAIKNRDKIVVYGDYDIDGITASAVMLEAIGKLGGEAQSYIPDRFEEGYGINLAALQQLKADGFGLVISVDCGVTSVAEIEWANKNGLDVIITDHHAVPEVIPRAIAVIDPKRPDDDYPFKELAGVGVAFKVVQALQAAISMPKYDDLGLAGSYPLGQEKWLLDLVALGTVCDVVPLVGENRVLAKFGLIVLNQTRRVGIKALARVAGVDPVQLTSYHLGFVLGPRMNAAGRLESASRSLELLRTTDDVLAEVIADELNQLNQRRQEDQAVILAAADAQAMSYIDDPVLVLADPNWSHGVVGIVASKLVEKWRKPTLIAQILGEETKGSARSTGQFDLVAGLRAVDQHFERFGGHFFAAGFTLKTDRLELLRSDLNKYYRSLKIDSVGNSLKQPDQILDSLSLVDEGLYSSIQMLEPFGHGNHKPIFEGVAKLGGLGLVGKGGSHLKLTLVDESGNSYGAIGFGMASKQADLKIGDTVRVLFQVNRNDYMGRSKLDLIVAEINSE